MQQHSFDKLTKFGVSSAQRNLLQFKKVDDVAYYPSVSSSISHLARKSSINSFLMSIL